VRAQTPPDQQLAPVTVTAPVPGPPVAPVSPQTIESTDQLDASVRYQMAKAVSAELGVDNLTDAKYFLFHPFPAAPSSPASKSSCRSPS